ncbi:RNase adapter RapZ [Bacillus sp. AFS001701]|uniref:RNase adapter RapZ n=1 Tax=Gottfriedia acidiceleris TaxID=371036 RepID=A0ABY4JMS5_9BACI|nr:MULTISPECIES: RNase adapter RapZ [Bacillaceae]PET71353.1 RNase adapter RapZ [Bacillus sp. AFS001701]PFH85741.1 RNase adapter RapZ [Bacillus sp. AFS088145]PGM56829.1 RNase adapter RapZ [Bacillus sp. AFS053548]UPM54032.1 RNase adapter RapZ [Gottfriedia acidiceleris]
MPTRSHVKMVIITGMSGAGKTVVVQALEDIGYFCVDNLPPALLPKFVELLKDPDHNTTDKVALVMDLRGREFFDQLGNSLDQLMSTPSIIPQILFLDATNAALVTRYKETRRSHPLSPTGSPLKGIELERTLLAEVKGRAQLIYDTSDLKPKILREKIIEQFRENEQEGFSVNIQSFGFKYGIPIDADLVFDVRFLPNPFYIESMRPLTGLDEEVSSYVLKFNETTEFMLKLIDLISFMLPQYKREGKRQLIIAIGCTGGQHRSVTLAEYLANYYKDQYDTNVSHRDVEKRSHK